MERDWKRQKERLENQLAEMSGIVSNFDKGEGKIGVWIEPNGAVYSVGWGKHEFFNGAMLALKGSYKESLTSLGWCLLSCCGGITTPSLYVGPTELTQAQYDKAFDWCIAHGHDYGALTASRRQHLPQTDVLDCFDVVEYPSSPASTDTKGDQE